uniref:ATPase AAA-type core domain-containing protein n=1 Tax=Fagus sylvatica TaxID=28930 RepID=A0A2N9FP91_FAGSY
MSSSLAAIILSVKPSFSLKPKPKPKPLICRFNLLSFKIKTNPHSGLQLGPRMSVAFCLSPSEAAAHIVVQDDLDAFLRVILDLGRCPEARYLGEFERHYLRNTKVSMKELEHAQNAVGEFGGDNRAGIEGTLHRISAIRSRRGMIVGLTCRVGRAISGHVDMVHDLLQYGKSILFVGKPGVGKTTVMREIARVLADEFHKRVVR